MNCGIADSQLTALRLAEGNRERVASRRRDVLAGVLGSRRVPDFTWEQPVPLAIVCVDRPNTDWKWPARKWIVHVHHRGRS
jgi:hypothetical protein